VNSGETRGGGGSYKNNSHLTSSRKEQRFSINLFKATVFIQVLHETKKIDNSYEEGLHDFLLETITRTFNGKTRPRK
jgi:hypothetical protein